MANRNTYVNPSARPANESDRVPVLFGARNHDEKFEVVPTNLNMIEINGEKKLFPGNISPEGYFYSPFYEVTLKELDDEPQFINVKRINFNPGSASADTSAVTFYNPETKEEEIKNMTFITLQSPVSYEIIFGQPFCIYDVLEDVTYRGWLESISGKNITIATTAVIYQDGLSGSSANGKSRYIISLMEGNAPEYAEFIPTSQKLVWRGPKKMSDLSSDSPIYNMPFTNGRLYIHKNINVFVRRQDPHNDYKLFRPAANNPLRRFQVEGDAKLDFDYIQTIIDSMVDAC